MHWARTLCRRSKENRLSALGDYRVGIRHTSNSKRMKILLCEGAQWKQRGHLGRREGSQEASEPGLKKDQERVGCTGSPQEQQASVQRQRACRAEKKAPDREPVGEYLAAQPQAPSFMGKTLF